LAAESRERCLQCFCCSKCQDACVTCGETVESEDEAILRILGIDNYGEWLRRAQENRLKFVKEEEEEMEGESDEGEEDKNIGEGEGGEGGDGDEGED